MSESPYRVDGEDRVTLAFFTRKRGGQAYRRLEVRGRLEAIYTDAMRLLMWEGARRVSVRLSSGRYLTPIVKGTAVPPERPVQAAKPLDASLFPNSETSAL